MVTYFGMTLTPLVLVLLLKDHENTAFDLLYVAWVPFGIETKYQFFLSYIMQWISTIPLYTSFISKILFINHINREFEFQCDKLKYALSTICQRVTRKELLVDTVIEEKMAEEIIIEKCNETEMLKKLRECEKHYDQLQRLVFFKFFIINLKKKI